MKKLKKTARKLQNAVSRVDWRKEWPKAVGALACAFLVGGSCFFAWKVLKDVPGPLPDMVRDMAGKRSGHGEKDISAAGHASETEWEGSDLPFECYSIPFRQTENYVMNKEVLKEMKDWAPQEYQDTGMDFFADLLNHGWREVTSSQDEYEAKVAGWYGLNGEALVNRDEIKKDAGDGDVQDASYTAEEFANRLAVWFGDNRANCRSAFRTHRSMLYREGLYCVLRGVWTLEADCDEKACRELKDIVGVDLKPGEEKSYVAEVTYFYTRPETVAGFSVLQEIKE